MDVEAHISGTVWKVERAVGDRVEEGDPIVILESMKMEVPVEAPVAGRVTEICCAKDDSVEEDQVLAVIDPG